MLANQPEPSPAVEAEAVEAVDIAKPPARPSEAAVPQGYCYDPLTPDCATIAQGAAASIRDREANVRASRSAWLHHGLDLVRARRVIPHGSWESWVKLETGLGVRTAENMRTAAEIVVEARGSENFADIGALPRSVVYRLAAPSTPKPIRDEFMGRLLDGKIVTLKQIDAALSPETETKAAGEGEPDRVTRDAERASAERELVGLLRRHLKAGAARALEMATRVGDSAVLRILQQVAEPASDCPSRGRSRSASFEQFQDELFPEPSDVTEADADCEPAVTPAPDAAVTAEPEAAAEEAADHEPDHGTSLVIVRDAVVDRQFQDLGLTMESRPWSSSYRTDRDAENAAFVAADGVNLTTGISEAVAVNELSAA